MIFSLWISPQNTEKLKDSSDKGKAIVEFYLHICSFALDVKNPTCSLLILHSYNKFWDRVLLSSLVETVSTTGLTLQVGMGVRNDSLDYPACKNLCQSCSLTFFN